MNIKQKLKEMIVGGTLATALILGATNQTNAQSVELMTGNKNTTLDLKVSTELAPKTGLFIRNRTEIDYKNNLNTFGLIDLSYNLTGGLDAVAETQLIPNTGVVPRGGLQYFQKINNFSIYGIGTISLSNNPDAELLLNSKYTFDSSNKIKGAVNLENITNIGKNGHNFSIQRIRLGANIKKYELGLALDITESKNATSYNVGAYIKVNF